ncbi:MAG TPA: RNA polymerase sigma factor [Patescibacteria group bacterium]|nr:RNA polymerase sigma factor [Patescibacteria group bacterium]
MQNEYQKYVKLAIKGNHEAFGELYKIFLSKIYRFIYYLIGDEFLAEDLTQNTFLRAWNGLTNFSLNKGTFQSYLYTIARNLVIDSQRKKKIYSLEGLENIIQSKENQEDELWKNEKMQKVHEALDGLPEDDRQIIILRFFEEMHFDEISNVIGKESGAIRVKIHRLMLVLRQKLEGKI